MWSMLRRMRAASGMRAWRVHRRRTRSLRSHVFGAPLTDGCVCTPTTPGTRNALYACSPARTGPRPSRRPLPAGLGRTSRMHWRWLARSATPFAVSLSGRLTRRVEPSRRCHCSAEPRARGRGGTPVRARPEQLLAAADVLVQGYRPGALHRYGLAPDALAERHPHLSVVTLSAWGPTGPWATRRGFDSLVQCPTGIALAEGADGKPGALPAQALDHATGYLAAAAAMLALAGIQCGEPPQFVRLSLAQTAHWLTAAGTQERSAPREASPEKHMVTLPGSSRPVHVIAPPGRTGDLLPRWTSTTDLGVDSPEFPATGRQS